MWKSSVKSLVSIFLAKEFKVIETSSIYTSAMVDQGCVELNQRLFALYDDLKKELKYKVLVKCLYTKVPSGIEK